MHSVCCSNDMSCPRGLRHDAFVKLQEEIAKFDPVDKADYERALEVAPHLVLSESEPLRFLRCANYNALTAAFSLVKYWRRRREVFGGDRAFLPLVLTGDGALSERDIEFIKHGAIAFLPPDEDGCTVACADTARRLIHDIETRLRAMFFFGNVVSENPNSQTKGAIIVVVLSDPKNDGGTQEIAKLVTNTFPFTIKATHWVNCMTSWHESWFLRGFSRAAIALFDQFFRRHRTHFYPPCEKKELLEKLKEHGLREEAIPERLGGTWSYEQWFSDWLVKRAARERKMYPINCISSVSSSADEFSCSSEVSQSTSLDFLGQFRPDRGAAYKISMVQLDESIRQLPEEETKAYRRALAMATLKVWKTESNPHWFLRVEFLHPWLAAKRLAKYWDLRLECFSDCGLEPITQTGDDAMGRTDNSVFQSGFVTPLPSDANGRSILFIDGSRLEQKAGAASVRRCLFYAMTLLAENEISRTKGAVLIVNADNAFFEFVGESFLEQMALALPLHFATFFVLSPTPLPSKLESHFKFAENTHVAIGLSSCEVADLFQKHEVPKSSLPRCFHGNWGYAEFLQWRELRTRVEWQLPLGMAGKNIALERFPALKPYTELPESAKEERKRRLNVIHARRCLDKKKFNEDTDASAKWGTKVTNSDGQGQQTPVQVTEESKSSATTTVTSPAAEEAAAVAGLLQCQKDAIVFSE